MFCFLLYIQKIIWCRQHFWIEETHTQTGEPSLNITREMCHRNKRKITKKYNEDKMNEANNKTNSRQCPHFETKGN